MSKISKSHTCKYLDLVKEYLPEYLKIFPDEESDFPVYIKENFLPEDLCDQIITNLLKSDMAGAKVFPDETYSKEDRVSYIFQLNEHDKYLYEKAFVNIVPEIESFYKVKFIGEHEGSHAIVYSKGGKYGLHTDNCNPVFDQSGKKLTGWQLEKPRRIISTILILTDSTDTLKSKNQCQGGDLSFELLLDKNNEMLRFKARKGLFLAFPSHPCFSHQVHEVTGGFRASIVDWHYAEKF
jgi:hypothetical protein